MDLDWFLCHRDLCHERVKYRCVLGLSFLLQYLHALKGFSDTIFLESYWVIVTERKDTRSWKFNRICQFFRKRVILTKHYRVLHSLIVFYRIMLVSGYSQGKKYSLKLNSSTYKKYKYGYLDFETGNNFPKKLK